MTEITINRDETVLTPDSIQDRLPADLQRVALAASTSSMLRDALAALATARSGQIEAPAPWSVTLSSEPAGLLDLRLSRESDYCVALMDRDGVRRDVNITESCDGALGVTACRREVDMPVTWRTDGGAPGEAHAYVTWLVARLRSIRHLRDCDGHWRPPGRPKGEDVKGEPNAPRRGWLRNGNSPGDPTKAPRCAAMTRRQTTCASPAMANGRCRMHGGASTGPRTAEGLARSRRARWKHGRYSVETLREYQRLKAECAAFNMTAQARHAALFAGMRRLIRDQQRDAENARRRERRRLLKTQWPGNLDAFEA